MEVCLQSISLLFKLIGCWWCWTSELTHRQQQSTHPNTHTHRVREVNIGGLTSQTSLWWRRRASGCVYAVEPGCWPAGFQPESGSGATAECGHRLYLEAERSHIIKHNTSLTGDLSYRDHITFFFLHQAVVFIFVARLKILTGPSSGGITWGHISVCFIFTATELCPWFPPGRKW